MSHSHTHAPGETHSHSHGPPQPSQSQAQPQPGQIQIRSDPAQQAIIDQQFSPVPISLGPDNLIALCESHKLEKCKECEVDFIHLNRLSKLFSGNPNLKFPPPPGAMNSKQLSTAITNMKEEGNRFFKLNQHGQAIARYTLAANIATQRPPWEQGSIMREELSIALSNRSAAYLGSSDFISALADAEVVISIRRNWPKGHLRKARALVGLKSYHEAVESVRMGLSFEPTNAELISTLAEIEKLGKITRELEKKAEESEPPALEVVDTP